MVICLCNCLRERELNQAIANGAQSVGDVYKSLGCQPQCGKCVPYVRDCLPKGDSQISPQA